MACSKATLESLEEHLTCPVCLEVFDSPKTLSCSHLLCTKCLVQLFTSSAVGFSVVCPTCRKTTEVPNGNINSLPENLYIKNMISAMGQHLNPDEDRKILCDSCDEGKDAVAHCEDCEDFLCNFCLQAHQKIRLTKSHRIIIKEKAKKKDPSSSALRPSLCEKHQERLVAFCDTCCSPVCHLCMMISHKDHKFIEIEEANQRERKALDEEYKRKKEELMKLLNQLNIQLPKLEEGLETVLKTKEALTQNLDEKRRDINERFDLMIDLMKRRKETVNRNIEHLKEQKMEVLSSQEDNLKFEQGIVKSAVAFMDHVLKHENKDELLFMKTEMKNQITEVASKCHLLKPQVNSSFELPRTSYLQDLIVKSIEELGSIPSHVSKLSFQPHASKLPAQPPPENHVNSGIVIKPDVCTDFVQVSYPPNCKAIERKPADVYFTQAKKFELLQPCCITESPKLISALPPIKKQLTVMCFDVSNEPIERGGDKVCALLTNTHNNSCKDIESVDSGDGTYKLDLCVEETGLYKLSLFVNGHEIKNSPFTIQCWNFNPRNTAGVVSLSNCNNTVCGSGEWSAVVGDVCFSEGEHRWTIQIKNDRNARRSDPTMSEKFSEEFSEPNFAVGVCSENDHINNSLYSFRGKKWTMGFDLFVYKNNFIANHIYCRGKRTGISAAFRCNLNLILDLNMSDKTLSFSFNTYPISKTCIYTLTGIEGKVSPYFFLRRGVSITLLDN